MYFLENFLRGAFSEPVWLLCLSNGTKGLQPDYSPSPSCSFLCPAKQPMSGSTGLIRKLCWERVWAGGEEGDTG